MSATGDEEGRAQRSRIEQLQGRAKQARLELEEVETFGFTAQLEELTAAAAAAEKDAGLLERDARATTERLAVVKCEVEEAERQLLAPRTVSSVGLVVGVLTVGLGMGAFFVALALAVGPHPPWAEALAVAVALAPPPLLAWLWRRRLSGGGTFRSLS